MFFVVVVVVVFISPILFGLLLFFSQIPTTRLDYERFQHCQQQQIVVAILRKRLVVKKEKDSDGGEKEREREKSTETETERQRQREKERQRERARICKQYSDLGVESKIGWNSMGLASFIAAGAARYARLPALSATPLC